MLQEGKNAGKASEEVSEEEIKAVIGSYGSLLEELGNSLRALRLEYGRLEEASYEYAAWRQTSDLWEGGSGPGAEDPMFLTLRKKEKELEKCRRELASTLENLEEKRLRIQRIHMAYRLLPREEFAVLKGLYQEKRCWKSFPQELGMAKRNVTRLRSQGISHIRALVKS